MTDDKVDSAIKYLHDGLIVLNRPDCEVNDVRQYVLNAILNLLQSVDVERRQFHLDYFKTQTENFQ